MFVTRGDALRPLSACPWLSYFAPLALQQIPRLWRYSVFRAFGAAAYFRAFGATSRFRAVGAAAYFRAFGAEVYVRCWRESIMKRKKRGGFCRPPRQLYPQEERGIQRGKL